MDSSVVRAEMASGCKSIQSESRSLILFPLEPVLGANAVLRVVEVTQTAQGTFRPSLQGRKAVRK